MELETLSRSFKTHNQAVTGALDDMKTRLSELEKSHAREVPSDYVSDGVRTWGAEFAASDEYKSYVAGGMKGRAALHVKDALTTAPTSAGALIRPDRDPNGVIGPRRRMTIRSLLGQGNTGSSSVEYFRETLFTNNAAMVAETTEKPESAIAYELKNAPVRTIAHWLPCSRQSAEDAPQLASLVDGALRYGLALKEEDQLLYGDGTGENLHGIIPQATAYETARNGAGDTALDVIRHAISQAEEADLPATGIILNTKDWLDLAGLKDNEGRYLGAGPFGNADDMLWRLPVVWTNALTAGTFVVGALETAAMLWDRMEPEVAVSDQDRDNFIKNMLTIRAEERVAFAVKRPAAIITGSLAVA